MELRHIKHFVALAECKSFSVAADKLAITQPSLTRSIQKMEQNLGVQLFTRDSRHVKLTFHGDLVLKHSDKILNGVHLLESDIKVNSGKSSGKLVIGGGTLASSNILSEILSEFSRYSPSISVELRTRDVSELSELLSRGKLDLFVSETKVTGFDQRDDLEVINYCHSSGVFCCRPEHPLVREANLYTPRLKDFPIALPRATTHEIENLFGDLFDSSRQAFSGLLRFEIFQSIRLLLYNSDMIGLLPQVIIEDELKAGRLVLLKVQDMPNIKVDYGAVYLKSRALTPAAKEFISFIGTTGC
ncbi:LysR family transcriptional regulator [Shewanella schlegeliana]|uniref:LysR family transcriptional regulator n=1 Tax=Shewanella schlegeliana TaxID=190308 RepID=A0ABS1T0E4_9GAMM|nr:LysR family transcriptional regulator [Shewanella schlegeliana]MBL4914253.1 LysR family transcriptional regulator [Shewanella schlegeliana]MCL1109522.1 LysR family transcriptional regulator [Shewanella schlegeliana]GIU33680.1 transcriptional regulator [Shewanella schlegeliana]